MTKKTRPKRVQVYEAKTKRWLKVDTRTGRVIARKRTAGAYADIPKRKTIPKRPKTTIPKTPATGRKIKYALPEKVAPLVHGSAQGTLAGGAAKKTTGKRAGRKPDKKPDPIPTNIKDLGRANVKTQLVRVKCSRLRKLPVIDSPDVAADILAGLAKNDREEVRVLYLNRGNRVIGVESAHVGSVSASISSPHEVYKTALLLNASGVMMAHNHPSGVAKASPADIANARQFKEAGKLVDVKFLDSIVIGDGKYYSLNQEGDL